MEFNEMHSVVTCWRPWVGVDWCPGGRICPSPGHVGRPQEGVCMSDSMGRVCPVCVGPAARVTRGCACSSPKQPVAARPCRGGARVSGRSRTTRPGTWADNASDKAAQGQGEGNKPTNKQYHAWLIPFPALCLREAIAARLVVGYRLVRLSLSMHAATHISTTHPLPHSPRALLLWRQRGGVGEP